MEGVGNLRLPVGCSTISSIADNFDYYSRPVVEAMQHSSYEEKFIPKNGLSSGPYIFEIETNEHFLSMSDMTLFCRAEVTKENGDPVEDDFYVAPINGLLNTMWKSIETRINNVQVSPASSYLSGHKAYIENVLSYESVRDGALIGTFFAMDDPLKYDRDLSESHGFRIRSEKVGKFDMCGIIHSDFLRSDNHLAPKNKLQLTFSRHSDAFILQRNDDTESYGEGRYKLVIHELAIYAKKIRLTNEGMRMLYKPNAPQRYLSVHTEMKQFPLPPGLTNYSIKLTNFSESSCIPKNVIVAQVLTSSLNGQFHSNPLNFQHFNLNRINLKLNGSQIPQEPLRPDFTNNIVARPFVELFKNTGKFRTNETNLVSRFQFVGGCALFPFDLTPDQCNGHHIHAGQEGVLELELGWSTSLFEPITILVYMTSDQVVTINPPNHPFPVQTSLF